MQAQEYGQKIQDAAVKARDFANDKFAQAGDKFKEISAKDPKELVEDAKLGRRVFAAIRAEWDRSHEALWLITGEGDRLHSNPALARSIAHRFPYVDPLHHLQVELLRRYRHRNPDDAAVERLKSGIHLSINGIAAGLRNTG